MPVEAPPAPAAAPVAPAAPAATPPSASGAGKPPVTASKPVSTPANGIADAYDQLDKLGTSEAPPVDKPTPAPKAKVEAPEPGEAPEPPEPGKGAPPTETPPKAGTLRQNYDRVKGELEKATTRLREMEAERSKAPADDPERKKLTETLEQRDKRLRELEEEIQFTNYERSDDYKTRYWQPFETAYTAGRTKTTTLKVDDGNGQLRQGTAQDFDELMRVTDDGAAAELAEAMFGKAAAMVMYHRERALEMNSARVQALDNFRKDGGKRDEERRTVAEKHQKEMATMWETENKTGVEKYPQWFKAEDGDTKGNELLERGFALADSAFSGVAKDPDTGQPRRLTPQEQVKLHSAIRNKAGGFDRLVYKNTQLKKQLGELEAKLKEYEESGPPGGEGGGKNKAQLSTWQTIDADLARRATSNR